MQSNTLYDKYFHSVSIIIPAYQAQETLSNCIASIQIQTYSNIDIIIVVDGATDNTESIANALAKTDSRITVLTQANLGRSVARNRGIQEARGDWILFVDADDHLPDTAVESLIKETKHGSPDIVFGNYRTTSGKGPRCSHRHGTLDIRMTQKANLNIEHTNLQDCAYTFDFYNCRTCWGKLYSAELLKSIDQPFTPDIKIGEDTLMNYQVLNRASEINFIDAVTYIYNNENEGTVRTFHNEDFNSLKNSKVKSKKPV